MMRSACVRAVSGQSPFDLLIKNTRIVNVFDDTIREGWIGIVGEYIAYAGEPLEQAQSLSEIDAHGAFAIPAFVDAHMHLESSMLLPRHFAEVVIPRGTGTVAADPHEIANAAGFAGLQALVRACRNLPLRVLIMAPSTVPSAPGFENSAYDVDSNELEKILALPGIYGLGEVMDFNGVADADPRMLDIIDTAAAKGVIIDGHASLLTGRRLQAFRASGIDSDHTVPSPEKLLETISLGFSAQVQECMLSEEMVRTMNGIRLDSSICLVTDDVPLPRLMGDGHLGHIAAKAISMGLDPLKAIRFCTINPARRLRLYDLGAIAPGMIADLMLTDSLEALQPHTVFLKGKLAAKDGKFCAEATGSEEFPASLYHTMHLKPLSEEDFHIDYTGESLPEPEGMALVNLIVEDNVSIRTRHIQERIPYSYKNGRFELDTTGYCRMAVFNRHGYPQKGLALIKGLDGYHGAVALTYGHDSHNLMVYGTNVRDMALAANRVIADEGGICAALDGRILSKIPLPIAGLLSEREPEALFADMQEFLKALEVMHFPHRNPVSFFTLMALAVSPEIKCTDKGLLDVVHKRFLPLIESV